MEIEEIPPRTGTERSEVAIMLKRIRIQGYKSLADVDVRLKPLSVLFGPNAAGKSNFLDAIQLLSRIATSKTLREAFEPPYRGKPLESFSLCGSNGLNDLLQKENAKFSIEADIELSEGVVQSVNRQILEMRKGVQETSDGDEGWGKDQPEEPMTVRRLRAREELALSRGNRDFAEVRHSSGFR